ncbi:sacsin N-terminal ATP-binding-like domain-containing protein [Cognataquiflexum rubidum]|uniref:sacsin N-terminal ATP-binding-like domain-containing protein n=1 Tax=Cognataquiflexum rubidum TaxID=2922273 RepID=UPI001F13444B|nr:ATP-binding protein [Cognataquiflexum rubidum]MCH6232619.1 ATP-binding protein [Cognataquiflexum rubidum]
MNETTSINRDEILNNAKTESELSDLKQHADKMIRGFENFNNYSSNRAVWELVQNACDLTTECEVVLDYRNGFSFTHNGKPFTTKSFISLIKQVSGKYGEESEIPEVGKYGTGFLTTHTFGRKFKINSILEANNTFFEIKDFLIDRSPKEWKALSENIRTQKENVYQLIQEGAILSSPEIKTTFTFLPETDQERSYIAESSKDLEDYIPIVLTINDRLKKVKIVLNDTETSFEQVEKIKVENDKEIELYKTTISKNGRNKILYSIIETDDQIEVILPINENLELFQFSERVARLFLYYPLIGSEDFGLNFIINCNQFLPTEPRDGIHLKSNKDQVKEQEEANQKIIERASELIFDFLKSNVLSVSNPLLYAQINFKRNTDNNLLNEYFETLQTTWIKEYKLLPIVETVEGFMPVNQVCFFAEELLINPEYFDDVYTLVSTFYSNIPTKEKVALWSRFASEWTNENTDFVGHQDLVEKIAKEHLSKFDKDCLINYYKILIAEEKINYFSEHTLLPNLNGKFCLLSSLLTPQNLTENLIDIGTSIIPNSIERLIHRDFSFNFHFEKFNRKDFSNSVKTKLDEIQASTSIYFPETINTANYNVQSFDKTQKLEKNFFENLLKYCKLNNNVNSQSKPATLVKIISKYYSFDENLIQLSNLENQEENLDIRSTRKILVQIFFNLLQHHNEDWVESNIGLLLEIANCNEDSLKEVYSTSKIYPNQLNQLKSNSELKRDIDIIPEIKDLYNRVSKDEIKEDLVYIGFNEFVAEDRFITSKYLTNQIEDIFFNSDIHSINEHPFKDEILKIISSLRDKKYAELFPRLDDKKANLMLDVVTNENTKDEIFSIVTLKESELKKLGKLVQEDNFSAILNAATALLELQKENDADFHHKHEIGTYIESLIRQKLSDELQDRVTFGDKESVEATNIQGGQDIVIFLDGNPVYFIEVKSRWNSQNSVSMSKLQLQRAVEQNKLYALCAVDITRYTGTNDRYKLSTHEILPLTKFVTNIGNTIKPLIEDNLIAEKEQEKSIHLIDYRGIIPQDIIQSGYDFDKFIDLLSETIKTADTEKV